MFKRLAALFTLKCPRCYKGKLFSFANMYNWKKSDVMPDTCSCCGQPITPEPGFYYGAMYMSYAWYVALFAPLFALTVYMQWPYMEFMIAFAVLVVVLSPYIFRLSRATYLYFFVPYDQEAGKNCK